MNQASPIKKEIVGTRGIEYEPIRQLRRETANELEGKLFLSSALNGWNASSNFVVGVEAYGGLGSTKALTSDAAAATIGPDSMSGNALFAMPNSGQMLRVVVRVLVAAILGGVIGFQRQRAGKPAGLRTHMLVAMGCAIFVLAAREAGMAFSDTSRVIRIRITPVKETTCRRPLIAIAQLC